MLLIKNGRVLDPASKTDATLDVLLDGDPSTEGRSAMPDGRIAKVGANLSAPDAEVFDANGLIDKSLARNARQQWPP